MKGFYSICLLLALLNNISHATTLSVELFSESDLGGEKLSVSGEVRISEERRFVQGSQEVFQDGFLPVGKNNISSLKVYPGKCVILTDGDFFEGEWHIYGPGEHRIIDSAINNKASSMAVYKMTRPGQTHCDPIRDIPIVYDVDSNGTIKRKFPLNIKYGDLNGEHSLTYTEDTSISNYFSNNITFASTRNKFVASGGLLGIIDSISVPKCYQVDFFGGNFFNSTLNSETQNIENQYLDSSIRNNKSTAYAKITRVSECYDDFDIKEKLINYDPNSNECKRHPLRGMRMLYIHNLDSAIYTPNEKVAEEACQSLGVVHINRPKSLEYFACVDSDEADKSYEECLTTQELNDEVAN